MKIFVSATEFCSQNKHTKPNETEYATRTQGVILPQRLVAATVSPCVFQPYGPVLIIALEFIFRGRILPYTSHIGMCPPKGKVFGPFWSENGYRLCLFSFACVSSETDNVRVVHNTRSKSIRKQVKGIDVDKVGSKKTFSE